MYDSVDNIELAHFHREYYEKYLDIEGIPHITVIRNPIDRFISASIFINKMYGNHSTIQELMEDEYYFYSLLENFPLQESVNWFRPQQDFISNKTHIWRFEDGFKEEFVRWLSDIIGIPLKFEQEITVNTTVAHGGTKLKKTPALIKNIKQLYKKEIEQYYPEVLE